MRDEEAMLAVNDNGQFVVLNRMDLANTRAISQNMCFPIPSRPAPWKAEKMAGCQRNGAKATKVKGQGKK